MQISLRGCEVSPHPPRLKYISKSQPKPQLTLSLTSGDRRRRKSTFLFEGWFRLYTQAPTKEDKPEAHIHKIYICFFVFR